MTFFSDAYAFAKSLPIRFTDAENGILRLLGLAGELVRSTDSILSALQYRPVVPTFVYVIPPPGCPMPVSAQCQPVAPGHEMRINFQFHNDMPAGCWIVSVGPATVRGVRVGNMIQESMSDFNGHICCTRDPIPIGVFLGVQLQG